MSTSGASDPDRLRKALDIFRAALAVPDGERSSFVEKECAGDAFLLREVVGLLDEETKAPDVIMPGGGIDLLAREIPAGTMSSEFIPITMPVLSGRYRLMRPIGKGAMGIVWLAEQTTPRRLVAVKVIKRNASSQRIWKRFALEAEALGRLHHPGIAQIFEAGVVDEKSIDDAYIVMEWIDGKSPVDFAREQKLTVAQKLDLVAQMAEAVQHAHQRGVIHRDLKPSNMLVDAQGRIKILDFGVARIVVEEDGKSLTSMHTRAGQIVGTLSYMSPEQLSGDPDQVDTRSDVFALGVVAYQLLSGKLPHDLATKPIAEAARIVRDVDPEKLGKISPECRGDVETIVARAMDKDRDRRYASAADLAADIRRFQDGSPIVARQDSMFYVLAKEVRRHRAVAAAVLVLFCALIGFSIYAGMSADRFQRIALREQKAVADLEIAKANETAAKVTLEKEAEKLRRSLYFSRIGYALAASVAYETSVVRRELAQCPEDLRRWEWRHLLRTTDESSQKIALADDGRVYVVAPTDSGVAGIVCPGKTAAYVDLAKFELRYRCDVPGTYWEKMIAPSAQKMWVRTTAESGLTIDVDNRTSEPSTGERGADLDALAVTSDDRAVMRARNRPLRIVDAVSFKELGTVEIDDPYPECAMFDFAEKRLWVGGSNGILTLVDGRTGRRIREKRLTEQRVTHVAVSFDDRFLAVTTGDFEGIRILDAETLEEIRRIRSSAGRVVSLTFTPDGKKIVTGGRDPAIRVYDAENGDLLRVLQGHANAVVWLGFPKGKKTLVSIAWDATIRAWDSIDRSNVVVERSDETSVFSFAFAKKGTRLYCGTSDTRVVELDLETGDIISSFNAKSSSPRVAWSEYAGALVYGGLDGKARIKRLVDSSPRAEYLAHERGISSIDISPDGRKILTAGADNFVVVADIDDPAKLSRFMPFEEERPAHVAAWLDDRRIVVGTSHGTVAVCDTETRRLIARNEKVGGAIWSVAVSPDGKWFVAALDSGEIAVFDADRIDEKRSFLGHRNQVFMAAFSPEGDRLATSGTDGYVRIWEFPGGQEILRLAGHRNQIVGLAFSPDGKALYSGDYGGMRRIWKE